MKAKTVFRGGSLDLTTKTTTKNLPHFYQKCLGELSSKQISVICDYIATLESEIKLSDKYRQSILYILMNLSKYVGKTKTFKELPDQTL